MENASTQIKSFSSIDQVDSSIWEGLGAANFPFTDHAYLRALESSGSVSQERGWIPSYLIASKGTQIEGASFVYAKEHSYGEYIFDWSWAQAYERHGIEYYPKLSSAIPFTPATGPKILVRPGADREQVAKALIRSARELMDRSGSSSLHYLFIPPEEIPYFEAEGFLIRHSFQYHWKNRGYASFDDFLAALKPRKRQQILRERSQLQAEGLRLRILTGDDLQAEHAAVFYQFYASTIQKMRAIPYLTPEFFAQVFTTMKDRIVLMLAEDGDEAIAGALYFTKGDSLFGRYWGATRDVRNLHFELCYYQPIAWAIDHRLRLFEAGAQGEHKIARGLLPELTYSAHWIAHPGFRAAITRHVEDEKTRIAELFAELASKDPYR